MRKKKIVRTIAIIGVVGLLIGGGTAIYMFNKPHRDVQSAQTDYLLTTSQLVAEYLTNSETANQKYLASDGNSKILEVVGEISKISENFNGQKVILLKGDQDMAGVSATFTPESGENIEGVEVGQTITIKGVIRSGASYDEDLELYENVVLEKSDLIFKNLKK